MSTAADQRREVELRIGGMTCASCAARIEKRLNKLDNVTAAVNYATEQAKVTFPSSLEPEELVAQVEAAGYTASLPTGPPEGRESEPEHDVELVSLRQRLAGSIALAVPVVAMAMIPALQFENWQWLSL